MMSLELDCVLYVVNLIVLMPIDVQFHRPRKCPQSTASGRNLLGCFVWHAILWQCACRVAQCPAVDPCRAATSIVRPAVVVDSPAWLARGGVCASGTHKSPYRRLLSEFCLPRRNTALLRPAYVTCVCVCVQVRPIEPRAIYGQDTLSLAISSCVWLSWTAAGAPS